MRKASSMSWPLLKWTAGLEPATIGFGDRCSTLELRPRNKRGVVYKAGGQKVVFFTFDAIEQMTSRSPAIPTRSGGKLLHLQPPDGVGMGTQMGVGEPGSGRLPMLNYRLLQRNGSPRPVDR